MGTPRWDVKCEEAFEELRNVITCASILKIKIEEFVSDHDEASDVSVCKTVTHNIVQKKTLLSRYY